MRRQYQGWIDLPQPHHPERMAGARVADVVVSHLRDRDRHSLRAQENEHRLHSHLVLPCQASPIARHMTRQIVVVPGLKLGVEDDGVGEGGANDRNIIGQHDGRSRFQTKGLDVGGDLGRHDAEQAQEQVRCFLCKVLQDAVKGLLMPEFPGGTSV